MISLTAQRARSLLHYDAETGNFIRLTNTSSKARAGSIANLTCRDGRQTVRVDGKRYLAHRLVWLWVHGAWPEKEIDHINGNPSDNRLINLRCASHAQNLANAKIRTDNSVGLKGVTRVRGKFMAQTHIGGKHKYLGLYSTPEKAHSVYMSVARKLAGEFATDGLRLQ